MKIYEWAQVTCAGDFDTLESVKELVSTLPTTQILRFYQDNKTDIENEFPNKFISGYDKAKLFLAQKWFANRDNIMLGIAETIWERLTTAQKQEYCETYEPDIILDPTITARDLNFQNIIDQYAEEL